MGWFTPRIEQGDEYDTITLYALNKACYDVIHKVEETGHPMLVRRGDDDLVMIVPVK